MNNRHKNIYFWLGLIGVIFTAVGVDIETMTSWNILLDSVMNILSNPFALMSVIAAVTGVFVNPVSPGLKDGE